jgi:hypothetical protein
MGIEAVATMFVVVMVPDATMLRFLPHHGSSPCPPCSPWFKTYLGHE